MDSEAAKSYSPPKAVLYRDVTRDLVARSVNVKNFLKTIGPLLPPTFDSVITAAKIAGTSMTSTHPSDTLPEEQKTHDIYAMSNGFSHLETVLGILPTEDVITYGDYARLYGEYRLVVLEGYLVQAKEGKSDRFQSLKTKQKELERKLEELKDKKRGKDDFGLADEIKEVPKIFTRLIKGQVEARLHLIGKDDDSFLYDPTIERLKEEDIRAASYQYNLLIDAIFPKKEQPTP